MKRGGEFDTFISSQQDSLVPTYLREADEALRNSARDSSDTLRELRYTNVNVPADSGTVGVTENDIFLAPDNGI
jgi:hypothetical protein